MLRPRKSAAVLCDPVPASRGRSETIEEWLRSSAIEADNRRTGAGLFYTISKSVSPGIGSWTHQYGDAGNTANS